MEGEHAYVVMVVYSSDEVETVCGWLALIVWLVVSTVLV